MRKHHSGGIEMKKLESQLGLPITTLFLLSLLGLPRVIGHDFNWLQEGTFINSLFAFIPPIIWITVVLLKTTKPFKPLFFIGAMYGFLLGLTHLVLWPVAFDVPPVLGGNLTNVPLGISNIIIGIFIMLSSVATGAVIGAIIGVIGLGINKIRPKR